MIKLLAAKLFAKIIHYKNQRWINSPLYYQKKIFYNLIKKAADTDFGQDHNFHKIKDYSDFQSEVPVRDYEGLRPYVEKMLAGKASVLWPGKPRYYA